MTEQELVRAAQKGSQDAFAKLVEQNQGKIYNLCYRMTGNPEDAADLTQEAFLNAWRGLSKFGGQSAFSTWLYRLASNACIDFLRREKHRNALSMTLDEEDGEDGREAQIPDERYSPQRELERKEAHEALQRGLTSLSPEHRQVLLLREIQGLSYTEIAQCLGLEEGTVKSRIARARLSLKDYLQKTGNFFSP